MGYREIELTMPVGYDERTLESRIRKELRIGSSDYHILHKSLDARKKENIRWVMRAGVFSPELKGGLPPREPAIDIPRKKRNRRVVITGSGPAGFFAALVLQRAGFDTVILERGADVTARDAAIPPDESSLINIVAKADLSPQTRTALRFGVVRAISTAQISTITPEAASI